MMRVGSLYIMTPYAIVRYMYLEDLVLLSPSEITQELCELMISIIQGNQWDKVLVEEKMTS